MDWRFRATLLAVSTALLWGHVLAEQEVMIVGTNAAGVSQELAVNRYPGLYTGNFGDCLGGQSLFNVTKFDAAYYADNMTVLFHIDGSTSIKNESLMSKPAQSLSPCTICAMYDRANTTFLSAHFRQCL